MAQFPVGPKSIGMWEKTTREKYETVSQRPSFRILSH